MVQVKNGGADNIDELNELLNNGWLVSMIGPMSGTDTLYSYALVILEKET